MPKSFSESSVSNLQNPSTHEVNAAVGDIKSAPSNDLAPAVGAFAKLAAETDDPVAEVKFIFQMKSLKYPEETCSLTATRNLFFFLLQASALSILAARKRRGDGPWTASDAAAIKSLVLQVSSTPGRFGAVPTRNVLFSQVCARSTIIKN